MNLFKIHRPSDLRNDETLTWNPATFHQLLQPFQRNLHDSVNNQFSSTTWFYNMFNNVISFYKFQHELLYLQSYIFCSPITKNQFFRFPNPHPSVKMPGCGEEVPRQVLLRRMDGSWALCFARWMRLHLVAFQVNWGHGNRDHPGKKPWIST